MIILRNITKRDMLFVTIKISKLDEKFFILISLTVKIRGQIEYEGYYNNYSSGISF